MSDADNLTKWVFAIIIFLTVFWVVSVFYVGGLQQISINIDTYSKEKFRTAVVLENSLTVSEEPNEINYDYEHRRTAIPVEFFTEKASNTDEIGYMKKSGHCYIPRVTGLDGENFGFKVQSLDPSKTNDLDCKGSITGSNTAYTPVMLIRKGKNQERLPARLIVYEIS